jgi:hypothetical protein
MLAAARSLIPPGVAFGLFFLLWGSTVLALGLWVARDARERGSDQPVVWALASVFTPIGLPYYLWRRYRRSGLGDRAGPRSRTDRIVATWASAGLCAFLGGAVLAPPDPITQAVYGGGVLAVSLPLAYLLVYRGGYRTVTDRITDA